MQEKLSIDEQLVLSNLLVRLLKNHDFGHLPEFEQGNWSRRNAEALSRDLSAAPLRDLRF